MDPNIASQNPQVVQTPPPSPSPIQSDSSSSSKNKWIILLLVLGIFITLGAGAFVFVSAPKKPLSQTTTYNYLKEVSPTPVPLASVNSSEDVSKILGEISNTDTGDLDKELAAFEKDSNF